MPSFAAAHPEAARAIFEAAISNAATTEQADGIRLQCEFHCNPKFRKVLEDHTAAINGV